MAIQQPTGGPMVVNSQSQGMTPLQILDANQAKANATGIQTSANTSPQKPIASSTTTASNIPKQQQALDIQAKANELTNPANYGISTTANGGMVHANGTAYTPAETQQATDIQSQIDKLNEQVKLQQDGMANGTMDENGNVIPAVTNATTYTDAQGVTRNIPAGTIPPGVTLTPSGDGFYIGSDGNKYEAPDPNDTSYDNLKINDLNDRIKANSDAMMASAIDSIQKNYDNYIAQQKETNRGQEGGIRNTLLMGTTGGSTQENPTLLGSIISYGQQQILKLQNDRDSLINQAKLVDYSTSAGNKQLQSLITQLQANKDAQLAEAQKVNDAISAKNQKLADAKMQSDKDNAVADLYSQGITDIPTLMSTLKKGGFNMTSKEVSDAIKNINPDSTSIQTLAKTIAEKGATQDVISKVLSSGSYNEALVNSGNWLSQLNPTEKLDYQVKLADLIYKQKQTSLLGEPTVAEKKAEAALLKKSEGVIPVLQDKLILLDSLTDKADYSMGLGESLRVGPNALSRKTPSAWGLLNPVQISAALLDMTGVGSKFAGAVHRLASQEFLDKLIDVKQQGAVFGALSDMEGDSLRAAATQINAWEMKNNNGVPLGIWDVSQSDFDAELNRIKELTKKAISKSESDIILPEEQSLLDNIFETSNVSDFYGE